MIYLLVAIPIIFVCFLLSPRSTLAALLAVIAAVAVVGVYVYLQQSDRNGLASQVRGTSSGTASCSDPAKTVAVTLSNDTDRQVNVVRFRLIAKRPGYSDEAYSDYFTSSKIIEPHGTFETCWTLNQYRGLETLPGKPAPSEFDWSVDISSVDFAG